MEIHKVSNGWIIVKKKSHGMGFEWDQDVWICKSLSDVVLILKRINADIESHKLKN